MYYTHLLVVHPPSNNQYIGWNFWNKYMGDNSEYYYYPLQKCEVGSVQWTSLQIHIKRFVVPGSFSLHHAPLVCITWSTCTVAKRTLGTSIVPGAVNSCSSIRRKGGSGIYIYWGTVTHTHIYTYIEAQFGDHCDDFPTCRRTALKIVVKLCNEAPFDWIQYRYTRFRIIKAVHKKKCHETSA